MNDAQPLSTLSAGELDALRGAAAWYAKYHASVVAEEADEMSAAAVEDRRRYLDLIAALAKLGIRVRVPDALLDTARAA